MSLVGREWLKKQSLTTKLAISILGSVLCGVVALLLFFEQHSSPILASYIDEIAEKSLQRTSDSIAESVVEIEQATENLKNNLSKFSADDENILRDLMHSTVQTMDYDGSDFGNAWVYVFEPDTYRQGTLYTAENSGNKFQFNKTKIEDLYASYPWFKDVPKQEKIFWTEPYIDVEDPEKPLVSTCIIPFKFKGSNDFNGLVSLSLHLNKIQKSISQFQFYETGKFLLLSKEGLYVVHPDKDIELKKTIFDLSSERNLPQLNVAGEEMLHEHKSGNISMPNSSVFGESVIFFYMPIPYINWGMCLVFPKDQFFKPIFEFQMKTLAFMSLALLILFFIISWICHFSTKPLLDLSKIAEQYGQGDFSAEIPKSEASDEIGIMSRAFRKMRGNLLKLIEQEKKTVADKQKTASELEIAQKIQQSALPTNFPVNPNFEVYACMDAAQKVGGDFYDFFFTDKEHLVILIADVAGKGIPAALYMMTAKSLIKTVAQSNCSVSEIFERVNNELCSGNNDNMFLTAFLAKINLYNGYAEYVCAGHNPPYLRNAAGYQEMSVKRNIALGAMENITYEAEHIYLQNKDRIFLYTDGVTEAQNAKGEFFGEHRLEKVLQRVDGSAQETLQEIHQKVEGFTKGAIQSDDITMLEFIFNGEKRNIYAVKADLSELDNVLDFAQEDMKKNNVSQKSRSNMLIAVGEIFANIAGYAYKNEGMATIESKVDDVLYKLVFKDSGKKFNPLTYGDPDVTQSAEERSIGGLGIYMVKQMADFLAYEYIDGYNILTIGVKISDS